MAMFDKQKTAKQSPPDSEEPRVTPVAPGLSTGTSATPARMAMIGQGVTIAGEVKAETSLKVEGRIEGRSVQCTEELEVAESGQVIANIIAKVVKISGRVSGDIGGSEKVVITRSGRVQGNIVAPRVQLEDGALFRGSIDMNPAQSGNAEKPAANRQPAGKADAPVNSPKVVSSAPPTGQPSNPETARKEPGLNLKSG